MQGALRRMKPYLQKYENNTVVNRRDDTKWASTEGSDHRRFKRDSLKSDKELWPPSEPSYLTLVLLSIQDHSITKK
jgi:hypothetical protein